MVKKIFNFILFGFVGVLLVILAAMIFSIIQENREKDRQAQEYRETQVALFGDLTMLCENVADGGVGDFVIDGAERPLILLTGSTDVHPVQEMLPAERKPTSSAEVDLVLCIQGQNQGERAEYGRCPYEDTDKVVIRFRVDPEVIVIDPASGVQVMSDTLTGSDPPGCPFSVEDNDEDEAIFGSPPSAQTIITWIELQGVQTASRDWGADILNLCQSPPVPDDPLAALDASDPPSLLILQNGTGDVHPWFAEMGEPWRASEPDEVDFVICAPPIDDDNTETIFVQNCEFMITGGGDFQGMEEIPVYQRTARAVIVDPASGDALTELVVEGRSRASGAIGGGCPANIGGDELDGIYGDYPRGGNFQLAFRQQFVSE